MSVDPKDLAPINLPFSAVQRWLVADSDIGAALGPSVAYAPTFTDQSFLSGSEEVHDLWKTGGWVSWLGGPSVAPLDTWPATSSGLPLAHVMTVSLEGLNAVADDDDKRLWPIHHAGLPEDGVLEVFHDLRSFGYEAADAVERAWLVRWVPSPDRSRLIEGPDTRALDGYPSEPVCQAGLFMSSWNLPPLDDFIGAPNGVLDVAERLTGQHQRAWMAQRQIPYRTVSYGITHAYGHAQHASSVAREILSTVLPVQEGDHHRLILDIDSYTHLSGWFGDLGNLEVWMRQSDVESRNFAAAWCLIRTD